MREDARESPESNGSDPEAKLLVSYDVARARSSARGKVDRRVFGSKTRRAVKGRVKTYRYEGLIARHGVEYVGQSVLLMPPALGASFLKFLRGLEIPSHGKKVLIPKS